MVHCQYWIQFELWFYVVRKWNKIQYERENLPVQEVSNSSLHWTDTTTASIAFKDFKSSIFKLQLTKKTKKKVKYFLIVCLKTNTWWASHIGTVPMPVIVWCVLVWCGVVRVLLDVFCAVRRRLRERVDAEAFVAHHRLATRVSTPCCVWLCVCCVWWASSLLSITSAFDKFDWWTIYC